MSPQRLPRLAVAVLLAAAFVRPAAAETYEIDASHSNVLFRVSHMVVSKVTGRFDKFSGSFDYVEGKPEAWKASAEIDAASINTANEKRDGHLRNEDFFDTKTHPTLTFKTTKAEAGKDGKAKLHGELTMRGVTKPVTLDLDVTGTMTDPWGNKRFGATATGRINRQDFGVSWNKSLDAGGVLVGDQVDITIEIEAIAKKAAK